MGILLFLLVLTTIVAIHEFGHFIVARMCGVHVEVFSIGMGPRLFGWTDKKGTDWRVCLLPLGGYVKMLGHGGSTDVTPENEHSSYGSKNVFQRIAIVAAGPFINFFSAIFMFAAITLMNGGVEKYDVQVTRLVEGSPAITAGIEEGDIIASVNGLKIDEISDIPQGLIRRDFSEAEVTVVRSGKEQTLSLEVAVDEDGAPKIGIYSQRINVRREHVGVVASVTDGANQTWNLLKLQAQGLARIIGGDIPFSQVRSIVGIGHDVNNVVGDVSDNVDEANKAIEQHNQQQQEAAQQSTTEVQDVEKLSKAWVMLDIFLRLTAVLSVAIGFMNLLPILPLDGGHLVTYVYEIVARRPMPNWLMNAYAYAGFGAIILLMVFALGNDLFRIFGA